MGDGNFPLLEKATLCTSDTTAFKDVDYAILLGAFPRQENRDEREIMEKNVTIFRTMGNAIENHASKKCKVIVTGNPANTNAYIVSYYAPKIPKENVFSLTRLDHNRAAGQLAARAKVGMADVRNVVIWGKHCTPPDTDNVLIKGVKMTKALVKREDQTWLQNEFPGLVVQRGNEILQARKASSSMSAARSICDHIRDLYFGTRSGEHVSMGVWSRGNPYGISEDLFYSFPVTCTPGRVKVQKLPVSEPMTRVMKEAEKVLLAERDMADDVIKRGGSKGGTNTFTGTAILSENVSSTRRILTSNATATGAAQSLQKQNLNV